MTQAAIRTPKGTSRGSLPSSAALRARAKPAPNLTVSRSGAEVKAQSDHVDRLKAALDLVARLCDHHPAALHIFKRLDEELRAAEAMMSDNPVDRARARLAQKEIGRKIA